MEIVLLLSHSPENFDDSHMPVSPSALLQADSTSLGRASGWSLQYCVKNSIRLHSRWYVEAYIPYNAVNEDLTRHIVMASGYDIILAVSPIFLLWNVQISRRSKTLLCGLLALGFL